MVRFFLIAGLLGAAVWFGMQADARLQELVLFDTVPADPRMYRNWEIAAALWPAFGFAAGAVVLLAATVAIALAELYSAVVLPRRGERLRDHELDHARAGRARCEYVLAGTKADLRTALWKLARSECARRRAETERDGALTAALAASRRAGGAALLVRDLLAARQPPNAPPRDPERHAALPTPRRPRGPPPGAPRTDARDTS